MGTKAKCVGGIAGATIVAATALLMGVASAGHTNPVLKTDLNGRNEVPPVGGQLSSGPSGSGEAYVFGIDGDSTTLCYVLTVKNIAVATAAHIHKGVVGTNGPVIASLAAPGDGNAADCLTEGEAGKFPTGERVADILATPANYYVNVHNAAFPGGVIRGQLRLERP